MADYVVETDRGHYITREEVYDILRAAEDNGFVHQITNIDGENKIFAICNCNVNVCYALRTSQPVSYTHLDVYKRQRIEQVYEELRGDDRVTSAEDKTQFEALEQYGRNICDLSLIHI